MPIELVQQGQSLLLAARVAVTCMEDGRRVVRVSVLSPVGLPDQQQDLAREIREQINERFVQWTEKRLTLSSNRSSSNLKVYLGAEGLSFQITAPEHGAIVDESGFVSTAAEAGWIIRDRLRRSWPSGLSCQKERQP